MAAFFILSGYTFSGGIITWKEFLKKQFKGIIVPYLVLSAVLLLYFFIKSKFLHSGEFNALSGIKSVLFPISGRDATSVYGLWFLPCILIVKVVFFAMLKIWGKCKNVLALVPFVALSAVAYIIFIISKTISVLTIAPFAVVFLVVGKYFKDKKVNFTSNKVGLIVLSGYVVSLALNVLFFEKSIDLSSLNIGNPLLFVVHSVCGSFLIFRIAFILEKIKFISKIGVKSLWYYGMHYEVLGFLGAIVFKSEDIFSSILKTLFTILILFIVFTVWDTIMFYLRGRNND